MEIQVDGVGLKKAERDNIAFFTLTPAKEVKQEQIKIEIKGPEEIQVDVFDNTDGSFDIEWEPKVAGKYTINLLIDDQHVKGSPFTVNVAGEVNEGNSELEESDHDDGGGALCPTTEDTIYGPGLWGEEASPKDMAVFVLSPADAKGKPIPLKVEDIAVSIMGSEGTIKADIFDNGDDTFDIEWEPPGAGNFTLIITYKGDPVLSPVKFNIGGSSTATAEGPGLETPEIKEDQVFTIYIEDEVDIKEEDIKVVIRAADGSTVENSVFDNEDGASFDVEFILKKESAYTYDVTIGGRPVQGSPFHVETVGAKKERLNREKKTESRESKERGRKKEKRERGRNEENERGPIKAWRI